MVYQLAYVSTATGVVERSDLVELLTTARRRNQAADITGVLVYGHGRFLQLLEGSAPAVASVYRSIQVDQRHTDVRCVQVGHGAGRWFSEWSMGFRDLAEDPVDLAGFVNLLTDADTGTAAVPGPARGDQRAASATLYELWHLLQGDAPLPADAPVRRPWRASLRTDRSGARGGRSRELSRADASRTSSAGSPSGRGAAARQDSIRASSLATLADSFRRGLLRSGVDRSQDGHPAS